MFQSEVKGFEVRRGKVRDVYDVGDEKLVIVSTDRISAFDWVLPETTIPEKGKVLTQLTAFWLSMLEGESLAHHHMLSVDLDGMPDPFRRPEFEGRTMLVRKCKPFPVECIVRGYLSGSGWKEYRERGTVCELRLPGGLQESMALATPLFTPSTKAESGHDENITFDQMVNVLTRMDFGEDLTGVGLPRIHAEHLRVMSKGVYTRAHRYAWDRGVIIADTKFEWGVVENETRSRINPVLIDEVLTPDSSRYWPLSAYRLGESPPSLDKQYVRNYLLGCGWDRQSPPPPLPDEVIRNTTNIYVELYERLTGRKYAGT